MTTRRISSAENPFAAPPPLETIAIFFSPTPVPPPPPPSPGSPFPAAARHLLAAALVLLVLHAGRRNPGAAAIAALRLLLFRLIRRVHDAERVAQAPLAEELERLGDRDRRRERGDRVADACVPARREE